MDQFKGQRGTILKQLRTNSLYLAMFHSLVAGMSFCNFGWVFPLAQIFSQVFFVCVQGFFPLGILATYPK